MTIKTVPNPDLEISDGNMSVWTRASHRRWGFHNLHNIARYGQSFRAANVLPLEKRVDMRLADLDSVRRLTGLPSFSALVIARGQDTQFERYAGDFPPHSPHSIQSISKTTLNLIIGFLWSEGLIDLQQRVKHYVPELGSGYADATIQQVLNMDVVNDYSEDFSDPTAAYFRHEEAMGWRLPSSAEAELTQRKFLPSISSLDIRNDTGFIHYKDANSDVLAWIAERVSGRPLRSFLADIADAAGIEGSIWVTTDREGVPALDGGISMSARDLARYMMLFARRSRAVDGRPFGSEAFLAQTLSGGVPMTPPWDWLRYSNQTIVVDDFIGHGGWGGQFALANLRTQTVGVYMSVLETEHAITRDFLPSVIRMLMEATSLPDG